MKKEKASEADKRKLIQTGLNEEEIGQAVRLTYTRGECLFRENYPVPYFMLLISGRVKITISVAKGRKLLIDSGEAGGVLGIVEAPFGTLATTDVEAMEKTVCAAIPAEQCKKAFENNLVFSRYLTTQLAEIVARSSRNSAINILSSLRERLCAYIDSAQENDVFYDNYTRLAEMLGVSSRHLFRELHKLCTEGVLQKEEKGYRLLDKRKLAEIAADNYLSE